jgi:hypothetical protein
MGAHATHAAFNLISKRISCRPRFNDPRDDLIPNRWQFRELRDIEAPPLDKLVIRQLAEDIDRPE